MYLVRNKGEPVVAERFIKILEGKTSKIWRLLIEIYFLIYLKILVYQQNNTYHCFIGKKPIDGDYSVLTEETELS